MKFAANLSLLWPELPFLDRFDAAAAAGFAAVEILFPYEHDVQKMQSALRRNGLKLILINAPPPNYTGGMRGFAAKVGGEGRFQHDMKRAFRYARALGAGLIHVMTGPGVEQDAFDTVVRNLKWACRSAPKGLTLTLEPLNSNDMPGYFLNDYALAARVLDAVRKPNLRLQYDSYHAQVIHGDAVEVWHRYGLRAAHIQIGDTPGRIAPGTGQVDFPRLMKAVAETEYAGWISAEYLPQTSTTEAELNWIKTLSRYLKA